MSNSLQALRNKNMAKYLFVRKDGMPIGNLDLLTLGNPLSLALQSCLNLTLNGQNAIAFEYSGSVDVNRVMKDYEGL